MINPVVNTYDFKSWVHTWGGITFTGVDEEGISIVSPDDMFGSKTGVDGTRERANLNNHHKLITVNLLKTNPLNDILSGLHNVDALTNVNKLPWLSKDLNGLSLVTCLHAWIIKMADASLKREADANVWVFDTGPAATFLGGTVL